MLRFNPFVSLLPLLINQFLPLYWNQILYLNETNAWNLAHNFSFHFLWTHESIRQFSTAKMLGSARAFDPTAVISLFNEVGSRTVIGRGWCVSWGVEVKWGYQLGSCMRTENKVGEWVTGEEGRKAGHVWEIWRSRATYLFKLTSWGNKSPMI